MSATRKPRRIQIGWALGLVMLLGMPCVPAHGQQAKKIAVLRIGTSGSLALNASGTKEETAIDALRSFIKSETGFDNEIIKQESYEELAQKMARSELELGVFQGSEFAWLQAKEPRLKALALAVDVYPYRYAYLVVRRDSKSADFPALKGQVLSLPKVGQSQLRLYVERLSEGQGQPLQSFFSKISTPSNVEDAVDDVVDGVAQAAVVDRVGLEAYQRRKPGRFNRLRVLMHSQSFPPPLVAYYDGIVDPATRQRFQDGLLHANRKEKGQRLLELFRLTGFIVPPAEWTKVLAATRKDYPPPK